MNNPSAMQVSWIDPDEVRALVAKLEGPKQAPPQPAWELHTLPTATVKAMPVQEHLLAPPPVKPPLEPELDLPLSDNRPGPAHSQIWNIREQLRTLRQQAEGSGILPPTERPAPAPEPEDEAIDEAPALTVEEDPFYATPPTENVIAPEPPEVVDEAPPPAPSRFSDTARAVMDHMLDASGPQPEAPPAFDLASLPQPMSPPTMGSPLNIEYIGPAPSNATGEPLFTAAASEQPVLVTPPPAPSTAPLLPPVEQAPAMIEPDPFVVPAAGLSERIDALARWACTRLATDEVLLVDDFGDVLWGGRAQTALVLSAMMAWHSAQRSSAESATHETERIEKELSVGRWLTVLPARTRYGTVSLAAIRPSKLSDDDVRTVRAALLQAVEGKE